MASVTRQARLQPNRDFASMFRVVHVTVSTHPTHFILHHIEVLLGCQLAATFRVQFCFVWLLHWTLAMPADIRSFFGGGPKASQDSQKQDEVLFLQQYSCTTVDSI